MNLKALKPKADEEFAGLEAVNISPLVNYVAFESSEVTALCPVTYQPDMYSVEISIQPKGKTIESKSLKLYFNSLRDQGVFCEELAAQTCQLVWDTILPKSVSVTVQQKPRGGIPIYAVAEKEADEKHIPLS